MQVCPRLQSIGRSKGMAEMKGRGKPCPYGEMEESYTGDSNNC